MQFKQWILNETDWPLFLTEGEEQVLALTRSILGGNEELLNQLKDPNQTAEEEDEHGINYIIELKYLPAFAFFSHQSGASNSLEVMSGRLKSYFDKLKTLVDKGKIKWAKEGQATVKGVVIDNNKGNKELVTSYLKFTEIIDGMYNLMKPSTRSGKNDARPVDAKPIFSKNGLDIYESNSPQACIKYGEGYGFCISQPGNTMWQSYRDMNESTFYFVFDRTLDKSNPLHIVVVDITRSHHGIQLTDATNVTGNIAEYGKNAEDYLNHLYGRGVPKDLFKNIPKTPEEEEENAKLGRKIGVSFRHLSYEEKSKYIGRGHELTDEQFDLLWDNNTKDLLNQYVNMHWKKLNDHQAEKVMTKKDLKESYLRKKWIAYELKLNENVSRSDNFGANSPAGPILGPAEWLANITVNAFSKLEFDNLKQEQQESIKKEIENSFDRIFGALPHAHQSHNQKLNWNLNFLKIYSIYEKGHHDIVELATRRLKKHVKGRTDTGHSHAKLLMQALVGPTEIQAFRDSIPFVHAIIKDVLSDHPTGKDINNYFLKVLDAVVGQWKSVIRGMWVWEDEEKRIDDIGVRALLNQIDMFEKRLKNNNWPGIWSGETQAAQIIDILVKAGADIPQGKERLRVAVADNAEELRRNQASWATDREADYDHFRNPVDDDSDQDDVDDNRTEQEFLDDQANILALMERKEKIKVHYLEFLIRYLDGLASPTKDVSQ